ncbi:hypothetical protein T11_11835 [Trichinella zimbabwensis]|uniref:Uncharacterized protein n=1 Tax=Trichinella zimbabwensis TaxID=268475 RepID=A0A0V1H8L2_9BILA|nr:hypothetical protein T11_11835 [Trichinella zimbabwensis]
MDGAKIPLFCVGVLHKNTDTALKNWTMLIQRKQFTLTLKSAHRRINKTDKHKRIARQHSKDCDSAAFALPCEFKLIISNHNHVILLEITVIKVVNILNNN